MVTSSPKILMTKMATDDKSEGVQEIDILEDTQSTWCNQSSNPLVSLQDALSWADSHPFEFDELVATKATPDAVKRWHEKHIQYSILPHIQHSVGSIASHTISYNGSV